MVHCSTGCADHCADKEPEIRNPSSEYSVATAPQHCALGPAHRRAQFVILNVEQSHVYNVCFAESQGIVPARVSRRAAASCAGVDDAAGGTLFGGISRAMREKRIVSRLTDTKAGGLICAVHLLWGWGGVVPLSSLDFDYVSG